MADPNPFYVIIPALVALFGVALVLNGERRANKDTRDAAVTL